MSAPKLKGNFSCDKCIYTTESEEDFDNHYKSYHKNEAVHFCRGCGLVFTIFTDFLNHIKNDCTKSETYELICGIKNCEFETTNPFKFIEHCKIGHRNVTLLPCVNCTKFFTFPTFLIKHIQLECKPPSKLKAKKAKISNKQKKKETLPISGAFLTNKTPASVEANRGISSNLASKPQGISAPSTKGKPGLSTSNAGAKPVGESIAVVPKLNSAPNQVETVQNTDKKKTTKETLELTKRKHTTKDKRERSELTRASKKRWKDINPFIMNSDSDPDDPTWEPETISSLRRNEEEPEHHEDETSSSEDESLVKKRKMSSLQDSEDECQLLEVVYKHSKIEVINIDDDVNSSNVDQSGTQDNKTNFLGNTGANPSGSFIETDKGPTLCIKSESQIPEEITNQTGDIEMDTNDKNVQQAVNKKIEMKQLATSEKISQIQQKVVNDVTKTQESIDSVPRYVGQSCELNQITSKQTLVTAYALSKVEESKQVYVITQSNKIADSVTNVENITSVTTGETGQNATNKTNDGSLVENVTAATEIDKQPEVETNQLVTIPAMILEANQNPVGDTKAGQVIKESITNKAVSQTCSESSQSDNAATTRRYHNWSHWRSDIISHKSFDAFDSLHEKKHLPDFFKCMSYYCTFTTDYEIQFIDHLASEHSNEKLPCLYCLKKFDASKELVAHIISVHGARIYQCSICLYRATSKRHIQYHFQEMHKDEGAILFYTRNPYTQPSSNSVDVSSGDLILPFCCGVKNCQYSNCFPNVFLAHVRECHPLCTEFACTYCKEIVESIDGLMKHFIVHGICKFQCGYCVFGAEEKLEVIRHLCLNHADFILELYERLNKSSSNNQSSEDLKESCASRLTAVPDKVLESSSMPSLQPSVKMNTLPAAERNSPAGSTIRIDKIYSESMPDIERISPVFKETSDIYLQKNVLVSNVKIEQEETVEQRPYEVAIGSTTAETVQVKPPSTVKDKELDKYRKCLKEMTSNTSETRLGSCTNSKTTESKMNVPKPATSAGDSSKNLPQLSKPVTSVVPSAPKNVSLPRSELPRESTASANVSASATQKNLERSHQSLKTGSRQNEDKDEEFHCDKCPVISKSLDDLENHCKTLHKKEVYFFCRRCGIVYFTIEDLIAHFPKICPNAKLTVLKCGMNVCKFSSTDPIELIEHFKFYHRGVSLLPCWRCSRFFTFPAFLIEHIQRECPFEKLQVTKKTSPPKKRPCSRPGPKRFKKKFSDDSNSSDNEQDVECNTRLSSDDSRPRSPATLEGISPAESDDDDSDDARKARTRNRIETKKAGGKQLSTNNAKSTNKGKNVKRKVTNLRGGRAAPKSRKIIESSTSSSESEEELIRARVPSRQSLRVAGLPPIMDQESEPLSTAKLQPRKSQGRASSSTSNITNSSINSVIVKESSQNESNLNQPTINKSNKEVQSEPSSIVAKSSSSSSNNISNNSAVESNYNNTNLNQTIINKLNKGLQSEPGPCSSMMADYSEKVAVSVKSKRTPLQHERWSDWRLTVLSRKSPKALETLHEAKNIQNFFMCMNYNCEFSTNNTLFFLQHQMQEHPGSKISCRYCFDKFEAGKDFVEHTVIAHSSRIFQCSCCLYRAASNLHVKLHFEATHGHSDTPEIYQCQKIEGGEVVPVTERKEVVLPYICRITGCVFKTDFAKEFADHFKALHNDVKLYPCAYCTTEVDTVESLLQHCTIHGLCIFQCAFCIFGGQEVLDVLVHQCLNHADFEFKTYIRPHNNTETNSRTQIGASWSGAYYKEISPPKYIANRVTNFPCVFDQCEVISKNVYSYEKHLEESHCAKTFNCPHCVEIFLTLLSFKEHQLLHGPNLYMCSMAECGFMHYDKDYIEMHCREVHKSRVPHATTIREECPGQVFANVPEEPEAEADSVVQNSTISTTVDCADSDDSFLSTATVRYESSCDEEPLPVTDQNPVNETAGCSWYKKQLPPLDLSKITVITPQSQALGIKLRFVDYMKISTFGRKKLMIVLRDLKEQFG